MTENISEENLIILIQENECLYNLAHPDYDNNLVKNNIWNDIARSLSTTVNACKNKWALLRSYYRRALQRRKTKSGQSAKNIKKWRFEEQIEFLRPYLYERETQSNLSYSQKEEDELDEMEEEYDVSVVQSQIDDAESYCSTSLPLQSLKQKKTTSKDLKSLRILKDKTKSSQSSYAPPSRSSKRKVLDESNSLSDALTNFIKVKQSESTRKKIDNQPAISSKKRILLNFFDDIAETILSFPELEQAEIKRDIFTIVNKKQIELLRASQQLETPCYTHQQNYNKFTSETVNTNLSTKPSEYEYYQNTDSSD